jgi:hypothetical protein
VIRKMIMTSMETVGFCFMLVVLALRTTEVLLRTMELRNVNLTFGRRLFVLSIAPRGVVWCSKNNPLTESTNQSPSPKMENPKLSSISCLESPSDATNFVPPCDPELQFEDDILLTSQFDLDMALESKFEEELVPAFVGSDLCSCHNKPKGACSEYIDFVLKFVQQVWDSGKSNQDFLQQSLPYSKLVPKFWKTELSDYFDGKAVADAAEFGWDLGISGGGPPLLWNWQISAPSNHPSARNFPDQVDNYLLKEQTRGVLVGPLPENLPFPVYISPLGTVEKPGSTTIRRVIVDSSYPKGRGLNSFIPKHFYRGQVVRTKLPNIDTIVQMVRNAKDKYPDSKLKGFKVDLDAYYRYINTNPGDAPYQCIVWKDQLYIDLSWSFGLSSAVQAAQRQSDALAWVYRTQLPPSPGQENTGRNCKCLQKCYCGDNEMCAYIDDFLSIVPEDQAQYLWDSFTQNLVEKSGLKLSQTPGHLCPPTDVLIGLGIEFDLVQNEARIPEAKLDKVCQLVSKWYGYTLANRKQLQELLGYLHHVSQCVRVGRLMVSRMLSDLRAAYKTHPQQIKLSDGFRKDLRWWKFQLDFWNGKSILDYSERKGIVTLDASKYGDFGNKPGLGAFNFENYEYYHRPVPDYMVGWDIGTLELVNHLVVARVWGPSWAGLEIIGYTDNQSAMHLLRHGRSRSEHRLDIAREFASIQQEFKFLWNSDYVNTKDNVLSDCLSRWGSSSAREKFSQLTSGFPIAEIFIPDSFLNITNSW